MQTTIQPLVIGTPRSGFSLLIAMIQRVLDHKKISFARSPRQEAVGRLVPLFSYVLNKAYQDVFSAHGLGDKLLYNGEFQLLVGGPKWLVPDTPWMGVRKYLGCLDHADFLLVTKHPRILFEYHGVRHSHDAPQRWLSDPDYANALKLTSIRHPLDIFNSAVHSINALASEYLQRFRPDADENVLRHQIALNKLSDPKICKGLMSHQLKYWREYLPCRGAYAELRWEDIITNPLGSIQWVAAQLGLSVDADEARAIWLPMDHRNLLIHHKHNYRKDHGIIGDWLTHLRPSHIEMAQSLGLVEIANALGYDMKAWAHERPQTAFQDELDYYLSRGEVFQMDDPQLAGFCFNKSNIDTSAYNFKSFPGRKWAYVERSTLSNEAIVKEVLDCAETGCEQINAIANAIEASQCADAEALMRELSPACQALVCDDTAQALLDQAMITEPTRVKALWQALQDMPAGSIIWGLGKDFLLARASDIQGFDALLAAKSARLADSALAGKLFAGLEVRSMDAWEYKGGTVILTPFSAQTRQQMRRIALARAPAMHIIDPYKIS